MAISGYKVGLVIGRAGVGPAQLAYLAAQLKMINSLLEPTASISMRVAALDLKRPEQTVPAQVKSLIYRGRVHYEILPAMPAGARVPEFLYEQLEDCDEVWCCPSEGQGTHSAARSSALYQYAQQLAESAPRETAWMKPAGYKRKLQAAALRFKLVPPWVNQPPIIEPIQPQPGLVLKQKGKW